MKLIFLVYDSRSGSTILAKEITSHFEKVFVTPEIGFDYLFSLGEEGLDKYGWPTILQRLYEGHEFRNFDLPFEKALDVVVSSGGSLTLAEGIQSLLKEFACYHNHSDIQHIIVKNGSHLKYWKQMRQIFGNSLCFLNIVRDPRAVINSKLRTERPYYPGEVMAWGGVLPAAIRWKKYVDAINDAQLKGVKIYIIRYEDLIKDLEGSISQIHKFFDFYEGKVKHNQLLYDVPEVEKSIHILVAGNNIIPARAFAWRLELTEWNQYRIEAICGLEMKSLCYDYIEPGRLIKGLACLLEIPIVVLKILRHKLRFTIWT